MFDSFQLDNTENNPYGFSEIALEESNNFNQINRYFSSETLPPFNLNSIQPVNRLEIDLSNSAPEAIRDRFDSLTGITGEGSLRNVGQLEEIRDFAEPTPPQSSFQDFVAYTVENGIDPFDIYYDEEFYLASNPDVVRVISNGLYRNGFDHFISTGLFQGRNPSPLYNETVYLTENPDVAAPVARGEIRSGFEHFINFGFYEGRDRRAAEFDEEFYLAANPGVAEAVENGIFSSGFEHFVVKGEFEGRQGRSV